ncbi:Mur ligase family protein [Bacteriovoracales bacterium]|nr:Mur ligase family protein [Bacteriovoracales bacterium]
MKYLDKSDLITKSNKIKKIFFYRICGTGMGAAAILLKEAGFEVEGGDINFRPPMSDYLESTKIPLHNLKDIDLDYLKTFDLIVVGNVVSKKGQDAHLIESLNVDFCSFPAAIGAFILKNKKVVGVSGTHGKTTTTYLMVQVFEKLGFNVGYFIGGVIENRPSASLGENDYFFIEADEYDCAYFEKFSKFLNYEINDLILTSLEFDHADIYNSIDEIKEQFRKLILSLDKSSIIADNDYQATREIYQEFPKRCDWIFYSINNSPKIKNISIGENKMTTFSLEIDGKDYKFETNLTGVQNILNLSSVILYAFKEKFSYEKIKTSILNLKMVKKRQEEKGFFQGARIIDDFAHHPRAIKYTIDSIKKKYLNKDVVVALEPSSSTSRSSIFQEAYVEVLSDVNTVILVEPQNATTVKNCTDLDCKKLIRDLRIKNKNAYLVSKISELKEKIEKEANEERVVLFLSNGQFLGLWESDFAHSIRP